jgi:hypothetical protein
MYIFSDSGKAERAPIGTIFLAGGKKKISFPIDVVQQGSLFSTKKEAASEEIL